LITFAAGAATSRMLIDCGSFRNTASSIARLQKIAANIKEELVGSHIDVVVGTHQHNDHLSGFVHCEKTFHSIGLQQVWMSWLDDPTDRMPQGIGKDHKKLKVALFDARKHAKAGARAAKAARSLEVLDDVLGFYGAKGAATAPELPAHAVEI